MYIRTQETIEHIKDYIQQKGQNNSIWHIGICQEAHDIIFEALKRSSQFWMYIETGSPQIANDVIEHFIKSGQLSKDNLNLKKKDLASVVYIYKNQLRPVAKNKS
ncbi:hypothetical protein ACFLZ8_00520 [Planctomycetota bacterium]